MHQQCDIKLLLQRSQDGILEASSTLYLICNSKAKLLKQTNKQKKIKNQLSIEAED
jgi:hypothetical protein